MLGERFLRERGMRDYRAPTELDRRSGLPAGVPRTTGRPLRAVLGPAGRGLPERAWRRTPCGCSTARWTAGRTSCWRRPRSRDHLCEPCAAHFAAVKAGLDDAGVSYELDPRLVRGLDYYTRSAFEWVSGAMPSEQAATVNAGGRYDGLAEALGGNATPGVGFAMGLDRVLLAMEAEGVPLPPPRGPHCFVVAMGDDARRAGRSLIADLRDAGISATGSDEERPAQGPIEDGRSRRCGVRGDPG